MRNGSPGNPPLPRSLATQRPPDRVALASYGKHRIRWNGFLAWSLTLTGLLGSTVALTSPRPWLAAVGIVVAAGGLMLNHRAVVQNRADQLIADDLRADEISAGFHGNFPLRHGFAYGMPLAFTLILIVFWWIAWRKEFATPLLIMAASLIPVTFAIWLIAIRCMRSPCASRGRASNCVAG